MKNLDLTKFDIASIERYLSLYGLQILGAIAIFVIGKFIAGLIRKLIRKLMNSNRVDSTLVAFISNVVYIILLLLVTISAISNIGVNTTSLAAMIGAAGLAIGLAFQSSLSNVAAGIILIMIRPFRVGDEINTNGLEGIVQEIGIMVTDIKTFDNRRVIIPNSLILSNRIINNNYNPTRRVDIAIGLSYADDLGKAREIVTNIINSDERILKQPAPFIGVTDLGDVKVTLTTRVWTDTPNTASVQANLYEKIKTTLIAEGFTLSTPNFYSQQKQA